MNYLYRYLTTLRPDELARLDALALTPRERDLLTLLVSLRAASQATKQRACDRLAMSGAMFDKTSSVVLRRALDAAVPAGGGALLEHLVVRGVYDLFLHELRRQERAALAGGDAPAFYRDAFRVMHLRFSSDYSEREARRLAARLRRLDPSSDAAVYVDACMLGMAVWAEAARRSGVDSVRRILARLRRNDARIDAATGPLARFKQLKAWVVYHGQLERDAAARMSALEAAAELCRRYPEALDEKDLVLTLCQIAEEHYFDGTDLRTPLALYRELFDAYPAQLGDDSYHTSKYVQLCLVNGELDEAERALERRFGREANLEVQGGGASKTVAPLWTKLMLLRGRLAEARRHLDDAILLNKKAFYLQFEIECRMLHTALGYLEGDLDLVDRRLSTHVKFLRSKGMTYATSRYYPWFFKIVGALIDERSTGKPLPVRLEAKLDEFKEGPAAQYGVLLRLLRATSA